IARAAARCFDSLSSCSSVRCSSSGIAASAPARYCIFTCRCLATAGSLADGRALLAPAALHPAGPVEEEPPLRAHHAVVVEAGAAGRQHPPAAGAVEVRDVLGPHPHAHEVVAPLALRDPEPPLADRHEARPALRATRPA